ncbi:MAG: signal recognition particle-docking protein FtsY, partial [Anaeroplasmataceae bacterium]|nr:signal recognition particle-docking protein FtsY [Anaeroplasmataceae bacterium]
RIEDPLLLQEMIMDKMFEIYLNGEIVNANLKLKKDELSVVLFVGVNGVGKTTSIAKIAYAYKKQGKKVLLAAGDTFRAGAIEQLSVWAKRVGVDIVTKEAGSDPSSVIFEACKKAKNEHYDLLLCDTAGRLQNKVNLMNELAKMKRVIENVCPGAPDETLLVIDATTGQNGMSQAKAFKEATDVTGVILTKLDGTSKGGIVLAIRHEMGIPIKYIGLGESVEDLEVFDIEQYLYGLFADFFED